MTKYRAIPQIIDGIRFASKAEARRYQQLKLLERAGEIRKLVLQPRFKIRIGGIFVCTYVADFTYWDVRKERHVTEDVKGMATREYKIKKKLMDAVLGIEIQEVQA